ncbi:MAG: class I SAM-dependent methyltransferase [Gemmatimonadota bacterium]
MALLSEVPNRRSRKRIHRLTPVTYEPPLSFEERPSYWFSAHAALIRPGMRVLDVACGSGRHALAAAGRGASVVAIDRDPDRLAAGRKAALKHGHSIEWIQADLEKSWPTIGGFDFVLVFNYLDRPRMASVIERVGPGGHLLMETFLEAQKHLGWGPQSESHLLRYGELGTLVAPLEVIYGREAFEPADNNQWAALGSVLAVRRS